MEENVRELIDEIIGKVRGDDGVSPTVSVSSIEGGYRITITDASHPEGQNVDVLDGKDGTSPTITIANITGGYRVPGSPVRHKVLPLVSLLFSVTLAPQSVIQMQSILCCTAGVRMFI